MAHVVGHPVELLAALQQSFSQLGFAPAVAEVPLAAGDDLEGLVALLVELDGVCDRDGVAVQISRFPQQGDHPLPGGGDRGAGDRLVGGNGLWPRIGDPLRCFRSDAPVAPHDRARGQLELAPPRHVGRVAEGADHGDAGPFGGVSQLVRDHRHLDTEHRRADDLAEERLVAVVVRMGNQRHASRQQFGPGGLDEHRLAVEPPEAEAVVGPGDLAVFQLRLGYRSAEGHVPQGGCFGLVGLAACEVAEERPLAGGAARVGDGLVEQIPVDAEADAPPNLLEGFLVGGDQLDAQLDEVAPGAWDLALELRSVESPTLVPRRLEVGVVGEAGIATDPEVVLGAPFRGQAVVVPAHGVEHRLAPHPLEAGDGVGLHVTEHRAHVQAARDRRRRRVDREDPVAARGAVEGVDTGGRPAVIPLGLQPLQ